MDYFYTIVLVIAVILLIIGLTVCAMLIRHQDKDEEYPKTHGPCPDKWTVNGNDSCVLPLYKNQEGTTVLGNDDPNVVTFTDATKANVGTFTNAVADNTNNANKFTRDTSTLTFGSAFTRCDKKYWANQYNIQWDGVSNYNNC